MLEAGAFRLRSSLCSSLLPLRRTVVVHSIIPRTDLAARRLSTSSRSENMASLPSKAKAVQFEKPGGPEVLKVNEVSVPKPDKDQVLVKVEWAGVSPLRSSESEVDEHAILRSTSSTYAADRTTPRRRG